MLTYRGISIQNPIVLGRFLQTFLFVAVKHKYYVIYLYTSLLCFAGGDGRVLAVCSLGRWLRLMEMVLKFLLVNSKIERKCIVFMMFQVNTYINMLIYRTYNVDIVK